MDLSLPFLLDAEVERMSVGPVGRTSLFFLYVRSDLSFKQQSERLLEATVNRHLDAFSRLVGH